MLGPSVPGMADPASLAIVSYFIRTYYLILPFADQIIGIHLRAPLNLVALLRIAWPFILSASHHEPDA